MRGLGEVGEQVGLSFSKGPGLAALLMIVHSRATSSYQTASLGARARARARGGVGGGESPVTQVLPYLSVPGVSQQYPCLGDDG